MEVGGKKSLCDKCSPQITGYFKRLAIIVFIIVTPSEIIVFIKYTPNLT